jgi:hypothetical protein
MSLILPAGYDIGLVSYELACLFLDQEGGAAFAQIQLHAAPFN